MEPESFERFLDDFSHWAYEQPDIQAVALVGSYARNAATPASDVDLVILTQEPGRYLDDLAWTQLFGETRRRQREDYGRLTSIRVWYGDGREIEYGITSVDWAALPLDEGSRRVLADGMRILFERSPLLSRHQSAPGHPGASKG